MSEDSKLTVNLYRDGSIESSHEVNLYSNKKQYDDYFFPRSSVKPMQVIPLLLEASNQNIEFTSEEIALFAASHSGQVEHIELLRETAKKFKVDLFEQDDHFGGHSHTYDIKDNDKIIPVDLGFIVFGCRRCCCHNSSLRYALSAICR